MTQEVSPQLQLWVNGIDRTRNITRYDEIEIENSIQDSSDTMFVALLNLNGAFERPKSGNEVMFLDGSSLEFAGLVDSVTEIALNPLDSVYELECVDFTKWLNRRTFTQSYTAEGPAESMRSGDIVKHILRAHASPEFSQDLSHIEPGLPLDPPVEFELEAVWSSIDFLAKATDYHAFVDFDKSVHFYIPSNRPAPINVLHYGSDDQIEKYWGFQFQESGAEVVNVVHLKGAKVKAVSSTTSEDLEVTEEFEGDGNTDFFPLFYEPFSLDDIEVDLGLE